MSRKRRAKRQTLSSYPMGKLFPSMVTLLGLCAGLFAIKAATIANWELAVGLIVIASLIDNVDGRLARMLNASSNFGAQLDSLADFLNFSVAPALVLYFWSTNEIKGLGWAITIFFIICGAIRLARFNAALEEDENAKKLGEYFFQGIAAPPGALLSLAPLMVSFVMLDKFGYLVFEIPAIFVIAFQAIIALLMVSRIPTFSLKKINVRREFASLVLAGIGLILIILIIEPWILLPVLGVLYLGSIPFSIWLYHRMRQSESSTSVSK